MAFQYRDMQNVIHSVDNLSEIACDYWYARPYRFDLDKTTVDQLAVGDRLLLREGDTTENAHFTRVHELGGEPYCVADIVAIEQQPASTAVPPCAGAKTVTYNRNRYISVTNFMIGL